MRIFGFDIKRNPPKLQVAGSNFADRSHVNRVAIETKGHVHAAAPLLPPKRRDGTLTEIQTPFGTNSPSLPLAQSNGSGPLSDRLVLTDPRELWYLALPNKLTPNQILQILRSALGGDLWQQWQLHALMADSWPMYRKCLHELFEPVSNSHFNVRPYCPDGDEPTDSAKEKAALVRRAMANFQPTQFTDEKGWHGLVYTACDAVANGISMNELIWHPLTDWGAGKEYLPRASAWVHPRHFTFTNDGQIAIFDKDYQRLMFPLTGSPTAAAPDPRKFLCAQFLSRSGSSLGAGFMRALAWDWSAVMFNREWMFTAAQNYGAPFVDYTYPKSFVQADLDRLDAEISKGLANRYIGHLEGSVLAVNAPAPIGPDTPQRALMEMADRHCCELLLGTESTTKATPGKLGGQSEGGTHDKTKRERIEGIANWFGSEVGRHFARAVLLANYGNRPEALAECPTVEADFTEATDPQAQAQRDQIFIVNKVPMKAEQFYKANNLDMPEVGDLVIVGGTVGKMGAPVEDATTPPSPPGFDAEGNPLPPADAVPPEDDAGLDDNFAGARLNGVPINRILVKASTEELEQLIPIVEAAERATTHNGEHKLLTRHLLKIKERK